MADPHISVLSVVKGMSLAIPSSDLALRQSHSARSSVAITPIAASRSSKNDDELPKISEKEKPEANQLKSLKRDSTVRLKSIFPNAGLRERGLTDASGN